MALEFNKDGLTIDTYEDIYSRIADELKLIYGADINLDADTPDGQRVGIIAKEVLDLQSFTQIIYSNLDVDFTFGTFQDVICKLVGLVRLPATRSQVDATVTTDRNITLDAGYTVEDATGQKWVTLSENSLTVGANTITLVAQDFGNIEALSSTINIPVTIVLGVLSVDNPLAATAGRDEESSEELRIRRNRSLEINAYSTLGSSIARLSQLQGVTDVVGRENDTSATVGAMPPHSVQFVVENGDLSSIAETLIKNKTAGAAFVGSEDITYTEAIPRVGLPDFIINHQVKIDRPDIVDVFVRLNAKRLTVGQAVDLELIAEKIASKSFITNENLFASSLYGLGYQAGINFNLYDLEISLDETTWTDESIDSDFTERYRILTANVDVTEVI